MEPTTSTAISGKQTSFFDDGDPSPSEKASTTFRDNMSLPIHRWFRYSAGFSAEWVQTVIKEERRDRVPRVFDPFAGSGTTIIAAEALGIASCGLEAHPFVYRVAKAKLAWHSDPEAYRLKTDQILAIARTLTPVLESYPNLIRRCYSDEALGGLDVLRQALIAVQDETAASELAWLTLVSVLRRVSSAGTAQWQYVLPKKKKRHALDPNVAFQQSVAMFHNDMRSAKGMNGGPRSLLLRDDARQCEAVESGFANLVITSPPYPNNFDYADATRLEMSFMQEIKGWGDLQDTVRRYLIRSCSQHVPESSMSLDDILAVPELAPIRSELTGVCKELAEIRESKGGRKTYHLMVACYFRDLAKVWRSLRRVCETPSRVCFVIGDSAPYGVYVPVVPWFEKLAVSAGFGKCTFEKTRDRNLKWKNRKHRVPLQEGRLWVEG